MTKKAGCLTAFGVVFLIIVIAVIIGSIGEEGKKPTETKKAKPDGTRFNPLTMKPQSMFIFCDQGSWNGEWK